MMSSNARDQCSQGQSHGQGRGQSTSIASELIEYIDQSINRPTSRGIYSNMNDASAAGIARSTLGS